MPANRERHPQDTRIEILKILDAEMNEEEPEEQLPASSWTPLPNLIVQTIDPAERDRRFAAIQAKLDAIKAELYSN